MDQSTLNGLPHAVFFQNRVILIKKEQFEILVHHSPTSSMYISKFIFHEKSSFHT